MQQIKLHDKWFEPYISEAQIVEAVARIAGAIRRDMEGKNPLFVGVLNGAFMFVAELMKHLPPDSELTFAAYSSYHGMKSEGTVRELLPIRGNVKDRPVILLEDVIDTGLTMWYVMNLLRERGAADVKLATMLLKPAALQCDLKPDYVGLEIGNDFITGFGLDYNGLGRNTRDIYKVVI
ncbi:MAG: hypoxanthine phosphoribosyltransferase [Tannerella sp.]|jgi:hypoxanthine phosphoribosyltransferase|nr:hypoxanthine phosphoribosyltransferase [Tannerella sp.]